ncbi:MAG: HIT family protein [Prevotella sp.]|nr:HIT family protein [Candidatus Equicola faecalis]
MASIFSKIIAGEIPSYKCAENESFYAFLDINPLMKGHTLVVPKREEDYFFDLTDEELGEMMAFTKRVAVAIKEVCPCKKVGMCVLGLDVPHAHIHLGPLTDGESTMNFSKADRPHFTDEEMKEIAENILKAYNNL